MEKSGREKTTKAIKYIATGLIILGNFIGGRRVPKEDAKDFVDDCEAVADEFVGRVDAEILEDLAK